MEKQHTFVTTEVTEKSGRWICDVKVSVDTEQLAKDYAHWIKERFEEYWHKPPMDPL